MRTHRFASFGSVSRLLGVILAAGLVLGAPAPAEEAKAGGEQQAAETKAAPEKKAAAQEEAVVEEKAVEAKAAEAGKQEPKKEEPKKDDEYRAEEQKGYDEGLNVLVQIGILYGDLARESATVTRPAASARMGAPRKSSFLSHPYTRAETAQERRERLRMYFDYQLKRKILEDAEDGDSKYFLFGYPSFLSTHNPHLAPF